MKLPLFSGSLYDDRSTLDVISSDLYLLLHIRSLDPLLSEHIFKALKQEDWHLTNYADELISIAVSVLLNEELQEDSDVLYVPITDCLAKKLLEYNTADFLDFFVGDNLQFCFDWLVSNFFYDYTPEPGDETLYDTFNTWSDIEYLEFVEGKNPIEYFDSEFSEYIKSELLQYDEKKSCYFLRMDFQFVSAELVNELFFDVYDVDYLFKIGVLKKEDDYEKSN
jgi:hypothetical protein